MQRVDPKFVDYIFLQVFVRLLPSLVISLLLIAGIITLSLIMINLPALEQKLEGAEPVSAAEATATFQNAIASIDIPDLLIAAFIGVAVLFLLAPTILLWFWVKFSYRFLKYELAPNEFREEFGIVWKRTISIPYQRIQNLQIRRDLFSRLLGLSTLDIQTAGSSTAEARLPGLSRRSAEKIRDELLKRSRQKP